MTIITKTAKSIPAIKLSINWEDYFQQHDLLQVAHKLSIDDTEQHIGTQLIIGGLRDKWTVASIRRIFRYVSDVISPHIHLAFPNSPESSNSENDTNLDQASFDIVFKKITNNETVDITQDRINIQDFALATIYAHVDEHGIGHYRIYSEKFGLDFLGNISDEFNEKDTASPNNFGSLCNIRLVIHMGFYLNGNAYKR